MTYIAIIQKSSGSYLVEFPEFPNINTYGASIRDALSNAKEALNGCLESDFFPPVGFLSLCVQFDPNDLYPWFGVRHHYFFSVV